MLKLLVARVPFNQTPNPRGKPRIEVFCLALVDPLDTEVTKATKTPRDQRQNIQTLPKELLFHLSRFL